jgi:hypothetical protein
LRSSTGKAGRGIEELVQKAGRLIEELHKESWKGDLGAPY